MSRVFQIKVSGQEIGKSQSRVSLEDSVDDNMSLPDKLRRDIHVPLPNPEEVVDYASGGNINYWRIAENDPNQAQFEAHLESLQEQRKRNLKTSQEKPNSLAEQDTFNSRQLLNRETQSRTALLGPNTRTSNRHSSVGPISASDMHINTIDRLTQDSRE